MEGQTDRPPGRHPRSWGPDFWRTAYSHHVGSVRRTPLCPATDGWALVSYRQSNGSIQARHQCQTCWRVMSLSLPYTEAEAARFPLLKDRVTDQPCARCGATEGVEEHHWAPVAVFGWAEANKWPLGYLCRPCHRTWHRMMGRP